MDERPNLSGGINILVFFFFFFFWISTISCSNVSLALTNESNKENPFTARASLIRYWKTHVSGDFPAVLLSKASPLSAVGAAFYTKLAEQKGLSSRLSSFCSSANLFCEFDAAGDVGGGRSRDANFAVYGNKRFVNYGTSRNGGVDVFKNYSIGIGQGTGSFARYSKGATGHSEDFASYADDGNVVPENFTSYAAGSLAGSGDFKTYLPRVNVPDLRFTSYDSDGNNHPLTFTSYADDTNAGSQGFISYSKNGNSAPVDFTSYGDTTNVVGSTFTGYGEMGNAANDSFKAYTSNSNKPRNDFKSYGIGGNAGTESFTSYRDRANAGADSFQSYTRSSNSGKSNFVNYGNTFNGGSDTFKEYGKGSTNHIVGFKIYGLNATFKDYSKKGITFAQYRNSNSTGDVSGKFVNKWVESGKFFRESVMKEGTVTKMPDIRDKMPQRSFLPLSISSRLPFSSNNLSEIKSIFHAPDNSAAERVMVNALTECERPPSRGETKRCVGSAEEMIDFAVAVLGRHVTARITEGVDGSNREVMIGKVEAINGEEATRSVSCHQSLYPYLLYYCHAVPKVRVYVADIHDVASKVKINRGVAICHLDTSAWSPGHGAFIALGHGPGLIEVCHWIFENDMIWTVD